MKTVERFWPKKLKAAMKDKNIAIAELSEKTAIERKELEGFLSGKCKPYDRELHTMAWHLSVPPESLGSTNETKNNAESIIGCFLKAIAKRKGLTQKDIADIIGTNACQASNDMSGHRSRHRWQELERTLGLPEGTLATAYESIHDLEIEKAMENKSGNEKTESVDWLPEGISETTRKHVMQFMDLLCELSKGKA